MLIVGGDSFCNWPLEELDGHRQNCWPALLAKDLNLELKDFSRAGCSNDRIFRYVLPNISESSTLVVVLWSNTNRYEFTNPQTSKIITVWPKKDRYVLQDWYLNYCRTLLYSLSISNTCKLMNVPCVQRFVFSHDCWWDGSIKTFKQQLRDNLLFDNLSDDMLQERFDYLKSLHTMINSIQLNESIQTFAETSVEWESHPTRRGHKQIKNKIMEDINGKAF